MGTQWSLVQRSGLQISSLGLWLLYYADLSGREEHMAHRPRNYFYTAQRPFVSTSARCFPIYSDSWWNDETRSELWKGLKGMSLSKVHLYRAICTIAGVRCLAREMLPAGLVSAQTKNGRPAGCYTHDAGKPWQQQSKMTLWREQGQCNVFIQPWRMKPCESVY